MFLGIEDLSREVAGMLVTPGGVTTVHDESLPSTVLKTKLAKTVTVPSHNLMKGGKRLWSMAVPTDAIYKQFSYLKTDERNVVVTPRVPGEAVTALHGQLEKIYPVYSPATSWKITSRRYQNS